MENMSLRIQNGSGWTICVFGLLAFLLGLVGLIAPEFLLMLLGFTTLDNAERANGDYTTVFMLASSMASLNMGAYYMFAAFKNVKVFYYWTVPFRLITFTVFTLASLNELAPMRFIAVGAWEGVGALATGIALYLESGRRKR